METNKRILLIEQFIPYPLTNGGAQAVFNGIRAIKDDYEVYVMFLWNQGTDRLNAFAEAIGRGVKVLPNLPKPAPVHLPFKNRLALSMYYRTGSDRLFPPDPFKEKTTEHLPDERFLEYVNKIISQYRIDVVQIEMPPLMSIVLSLPSNVKKIYVHHELRFERNRLELIALGSNLYRQSAVEINKLLEIGLLNKYDAIVTLSPVDKQKLIAAGVNKPVFQSFATVRTPKVYDPSTEGSKVITFVGPEFHVPNKDGIDWFLDECWSKLLSKDNSYIFRIVGNWNADTIKSVQEKYANIEFLGFVDDLNSVLHNTVMIVPIRIGSGIRMKILEAAAAGVPFVSTTVGAEGLPFTDGQDCFITDDPDKFIDDILLLRDEKLMSQFVYKAHRIVEERYSASALRKNRTDIIRQVIEA